MDKRDFLKYFAACTLTKVMCPTEIYAQTIVEREKASLVGRSSRESGFLDLKKIFLPGDPFLLDAQRNGERFMMDLRTREGYEKARHLLRDIRDQNSIGFPNPYLLRLAAWFQAYVAQNHNYTVLQITSGLRTARSNSKLEGAAQNSKHLMDQYGFFHAMDVKPVGLSVDLAGNIVSLAKHGGVGLYRTHVHFDIREKVTTWGK